MTEHVPSINDLRDIAEFIRARSLDEAGAAGRMDFYWQNGVTLQVSIPKSALLGDLDTHRANVTSWLDEHSPNRFMEMAAHLATLADGMADAVIDASEVHGPFRARSAWRRLTRAARLWQTHPDFNPAWAEQEKQDQA